MKVPVEWVRSFGDFDDLSDGELADQLTMAGLEVEEIHSSGPTAVYVTKVTPNRGDWMSIFGVAREAAAAAERPLHRPIPLTALPTRTSIDGLTVDVVDGSLCPRYGAAIVTDLRPNSSPKFIQDRLILAGMRPLNAIVDITNYVMLEIGQPLHAFDLRKIAGKRIVIRPAMHQETLVTLDGVTHTLPDDILVIADPSGPIALAGIMGGASTEVTAETTSIVLESAHFDPGVIRRSAKRLGISTEASYRFERFVDPALVQVAIVRAVELLSEHAGGVAAEGAIDVLAREFAPVTISLRTDRVNLVLGLALKTEEIAHALARLGLNVISHGSALDVSVPSFRSDLTTEIDLIEEVGRMIGYWNLPETVPSRPGTVATDFDKSLFDSSVRQILVGQGLVEAYSHTLGSASPFDDPTAVASRVTVRISLSVELSGLRLTLLPHLLDALALNLRHGAPAVRLFEVGKVFHRVDHHFTEPRHVGAALSGPGLDFATAKGIVENFLTALGIKNVVFTPAERPAMHTGRTADVIIEGRTAGYIAELDPYFAAEHLELPPGAGRIAAFELDLERLRTISEHLAVRSYVPLPKFPSVSRDLALLYDLDIPFGRIESAARSGAGELLEELALLSVYTGDRVPLGKKSVAIRLTLRSLTRTLTESDAEAAVAAVRTELTEQLAAADR